jgi:predicted nucleic acid-binding protein
LAPRAKPYLIDSVIVIDHLNGVEAATEFLRSVGGAGMLSVITRAEVLSGVAREDLPIVKRLLDRFRTMDITVAVADRAARLRHRNGWKLPDALQAAVAIEQQSYLATRNTRDFPPRRFRFVRVPYHG